MDNSLLMQILRLHFIIFILVGSFFFLKYTLFYLYPLAIAFLVSLTLHPLVTKIEKKWRVQRGFSVIIVISGFLVPLLSSGYLFFKYISIEFITLFSELPAYFETLTKFLEQMEQNYLTPFYEKVASFFPTTMGEPKVYVTNLVNKLNESTATLLKQMIWLSTNFLSSFAYLVAVFIFTLITIYFMTKDAPMLSSIFHRFLPTRITTYVQQIRYYTKKSVFGMIRAQLILAFVTSFISFIIFLFFQSGHALTLSTVVFFIDLIPYVGVGALFIPWIFYQFFSKGYLLAIQLSLLYMFLIIVRQIIEPRLLATSLGVHPLVALIVLFLGVQLFGVIGIFLTPLVLISISSLYHAKIIHLMIDFIRDG